MWLNASIPEEYDLDIPTIPSASIRETLEACPYIPVCKPNRRGCPSEIPVMSVEFHNLCMTRSAVPDFDSFVEDYMSNNADWIRVHAANFVEPLMARVERSYPSLIRDVYFVSVGREAGFELERTLRMDFDGIDAILDKNVPIRLFFDSKRSRLDKMRKSIVHGVPPNCVDFACDPKRAEVVGGVYLYDRAAIEEFLSGLRAGDSDASNET